MQRSAYHKIIALVREASDLARSIGIPNLLQPGLVKEMIIADILGHELIHSKRDADARPRQSRRKVRIPFLHRGRQRTA